MPQNGRECVKCLINWLVFILNPDFSNSAALRSEMRQNGRAKRRLRINFCGNAGICLKRAEEML